MARYPSRAGIEYSKQANNYYADMVESMRRFRQDALHHKNPAVPMVGLFLAGARAVGRLRLAPLEEILPHDLSFALTVRDTLVRDFTGVTFEVRRFDARHRAQAPWVGTAVLTAVELEAGFGYAPTDRTASVSHDRLEFCTSEGIPLLVNCADMVASENALHDTHLRLPEGLHPEVWKRYAAFGSPQ